MNTENVHTAVRERYGEIAKSSGSCCDPGCCSPSTGLGYQREDLARVPKTADLGLGCGNPLASAWLEEGETVLDFGSGPGLDCLLAAEKVGPTGRVIGVDMTPAMLDRARDNARAAGLSNVEFRLGEIEHLPVADNSVDVVISNCVISLSPDKPAVFREAFRVLRSGGRVAVADMVAVIDLPEEARQDLDALTGCLAGAASLASVEKMLTDAGFVDVRVQAADGSKRQAKPWVPGADLAEYVFSGTIEARKS